MSNALPMGTAQREANYLRQTPKLTPRQWRQLNRMSAREYYRWRGELTHGGSGRPATDREVAS